MFKQMMLMAVLCVAGCEASQPRHPLSRGPQERLLNPGDVRLQHLCHIEPERLECSDQYH